MALFDRRKDAKPSAPEEPVVPQPVAEEPPAEEAVATKKVAAAPPAPPKPSAAEPTSEPAAPAVKAQAGPTIHTVGTGESLADLASAYGVPAEEIARQNHLPASGAIYPGQVFVIRS